MNDNEKPFGIKDGLGCSLLALGVCLLIGSGIALVIGIPAAVLYHFFGG